MNLLKNIHIFRDLREENLDKLGKIAVEEHFQEGDVLFREGDTSSAFYIIHRGSVRIIRNSEGPNSKVLAELSAGDFFGEMGVIEETPRFADAVVSEASHLLVVRKSDFDDLMAVNPSIAMKIMVTVTRRYKANHESGDVSVPAVSGGATAAVVPQPSQGMLVAGHSPTGGAGVSTLLSNLGVALADRGKKVLLIDGSTQFGDLSVFLDVIPNATLYQMAEEENWEPDFIQESYVHSTKFGVDFIAAPLKPEQSEVVTADLFRILIDGMRSLYDYILIDTYSLMQEPILTLLEMADEILYVMNPELPSMKNARLWSELLEALEFSRAPVRTVLNKFDDRAVVTKQQIEKNLQTEVDLVIPFDRDSTMSCINRGEMLVRYLPKQPISMAILTLADKMLNIESAQQGEDVSFLSNWMGRIKNRFKITG
jgi:MinD-like ATPase involved in chromosome partitioning or flagellar assembly